jgi:hypothetical protein
MAREWWIKNRTAKPDQMGDLELISPDGEAVAIIRDFAIANEIAAAMNLTTEVDRQTYCAKIYAGKV